MDLVKEALDNIPDSPTSPVSDIPGGWEIAKRINALTAVVPAIGTLTPASSGQELRAAVQQLPAQYQMEVLSIMLESKSAAGSAAACPTPSLEQIDAMEDRKLRRWVIKAVVLMILFVCSVMTGAVAVIAVKSGQLPDTTFLKGMIDTAAEIAKLIFSGST